MIGRLAGSLVRGAFKRKGRSKGRGGSRSGGGVVGIHLDMDRLEALIDSIGPDADDIIDEAAQAIRGEAQEGAPIGPTGNLAGGMTVERTGHARRKIGPSVDYGIFVELGTRHRAARPFLRPAFDREVAQLRGRLKELFD